MSGPKSFTDLLNQPPCLWPKRGDRLLRSAHDWDGAITFSDHPFARDAHIWSGYMLAGAALVDQTEREGVDRHSLIYPILFNYRHGLEVAMKWVIDQYGPYACVHVDIASHDLWMLWKSCKQIIVAIET